MSGSCLLLYPTMQCVLELVLIDFVALNWLTTCTICNWLWAYVWALQKRTLMIGLFLQHRTLTLKTVKPQSLSHFSSLPLVHSFDPLLNSTPLAPHLLHTLPWEWSGGVENKFTLHVI